MKKLFTTMLLLLALVVVGKAQQILLHEDFQQGLPSGWESYDADGDGHIWSCIGMAGLSGENDTCITSQSYVSGTGPLHPDNWLITRAITIPANSYPMLYFWVCAQDASYAHEHYGVYVTTATTPADLHNPNSYQCLFEETIDANGGSRAQGAWKQKTAVLQAYAGQTIHIAFRHYNVSDEFYINLDEVSVEVITDPTMFVSSTAFQFSPAAPNSDFGRKDFNVTGVLLNDDITISLPQNSPFRISTDTINYGNTVTLPQNNGNVPVTPIYVTFNPTTVGYYEDVISIVSPGTPSKSINVKGMAIDCSQNMPIPWFEDFTSEDFPANCWTMTSTDTADYEAEDDDGNPVVYPGVKYYTWFNSPSNQYASVRGDANRVQDEHLYTPVFNLSNATGAADFQFDLRTNPQVNAMLNGFVRFTVGMSTDGGTTFNTIWDIQDILDDFNAYWSGWSDIWPVHFNMDQYVGTNTNIQFDFHYEADIDAADQVIIQNLQFTNYFEPRLDVLAEDTITMFSYVGNPEAIVIPVEGRNLDTIINVSATAPFEVSSDGSSFGATATLPAIGGNLYARFNPTTVINDANGIITISNVRADSTFSKSIAVIGNSYECVNTLPIVQSFESADSTVLAPNTTEYCWLAFKFNKRDAQNDIINSNDYAYDGNTALRFSSIKYNARQVYDEYLISPELSATSPMMVMFNYANSSALKDETFRVGYSTTGNDINDFTWENDIVNSANTDWQLYRNPNVPADVKYVAVHYKSERKAYLYIDNFQIMTVPSCYFPVSVKAENTGVDNADITWTAGANETSWEIAYSVAPLTLATATATPVSTLGTTLTGLTAETHYQIAVRAICNDGYSDWSEIADFWTTSAPATLPYTQTFEDNDADRGNWVLVNGNEPNYFAYGQVANLAGSKALMITNDGVNNTYETDNTSRYSTVWAYRDILFPNDNVPGYLLTLKWRCYGEVDYDFGELFIGNATEVTNFERDENVPGFVDVNTAHYTPTGLTKLDRFVNKSQAQDAIYLIPSDGMVGKVKRLYFLWTNDSLSGTNPPLAVDNIDLRIPDFSNMSGVVTSATTGDPIPGAVVAIVSDQGFSASATTDANGQYTIANVVTGYYDVTVSAHGYQTDNGGYYLQTGDNPNINYELALEECFILPTHVQYTIEDDNLVLTWDAIEGGIMTQNIRSNYQSAIGMSNASKWDFGVYHMFNPTHLNSYNGGTITSIGGYFNGEPEYSTYKLRIWIGGSVSDGPASPVPVYEQEVNPEDIRTGAWNDITLTTPYVIDGSQCLWVGYHVYVDGSTGIYAAGVTDQNNANEGYGNVVHDDGDWTTLTGLNDQLLYNWMIRANVVAPDLSYTVLEDGLPIATDIEEAEYVVYSYDPTACYQVTTTCENGEVSNPSECATEVSISNVDNAVSFEVYPNPTHETVNVSTTMDVQKVEVLNYLGQVIFSQNITNHHFTLNVANYADGVYFIRLSGNDGIATQKLVKR